MKLQSITQFTGVKFDAKAEATSALKAGLNVENLLDYLEKRFGRNWEYKQSVILVLLEDSIFCNTISHAFIDSFLSPSFIGTRPIGHARRTCINLGAVRNFIKGVNTSTLYNILQHLHTERKEAALQKASKKKGKKS